MSSTGMTRRGHWDDIFQHYIMNKINFLKFIELCFQTVVPGCEYNDYQYTSNFSVCTTWAKTDNKFYLLDVYRAKLEYPKLKEQVLSLAARWTPHAILIEAKTSGQQLVQELKTNSDLPIIEIVPHDDKLTRFYQIVPIIESGKVFLPHQAVWLSDFEYEILMFPETRHDDQVG